MTSAAERLASNINLGVLGRATELKKRLWFVVGALIVYRIGTYIPLPGVDTHVLGEMFKQNSGGVLGMFNMFTGGALSRMTIFALAVMPYISASIIIQLMTSVSDSLAALKKEGEAGRRKIQQYTRYGTVLLAGIQGFGIAVGLESMTGASGPLVMEPGLFFRISTMVTLTGGTMFIMWLGEQITSRGIGNGISLIIFTGIVAELPSALASTFELGRRGAMSTEFIFLLVLLALALIAFIVFIERAQRRILIQYPKRQVGNKLYAGDNSHLPLKMNSSGVIPPIFASSLLLFPMTIAGFNVGDGTGVMAQVAAYLAPGQPLYLGLYVSAIIFFSFFYTSVVFNPKDTAEMLKKNGGFIPGIRPGQNTQEYIDFVLTRLTVIGAAYLSIVCVAPEILTSSYSVPFHLGGTSLLIVVNVTMDTVTQIQSHLFAHQYEGLIRKSRLKGRKR
ncbi:MAG: preprotein translocase subunit SecY [Alphaproteobacteria bacterium]|nr:preprotein translocase subunit SecY [Alphaproteobacteria bacterium]